MEITGNIIVLSEILSENACHWHNRPRSSLFYFVLKVFPQKQSHNVGELHSIPLQWDLIVICPFMEGSPTTSLQCFRRPEKDSLTESC